MQTRPETDLFREDQVLLAVPAIGPGRDQRHRSDDVSAGHERHAHERLEPQLLHDAEVLLVAGGFAQELFGHDRRELGAP